MHKIFITGIAGFIGFHTAKHLINKGYEVSGMDNFDDYYDPQFKYDRQAILHTQYGSITDDDNIETADWQDILKDYDAVIHLAAHAGVRHSLNNPQMYIDTNISATQRLIHACEDLEIPVIYASSSTADSDHLNPYAWSKYVNEKQFETSKLISAGLRFYTVYGEWGRPDMALHTFADLMSRGKAIDIYNYGDMQRDFTYVGDLVDGIEIILEYVLNQPQENPHEIYNLGTGKSNELMDYIECLENELGRIALKNMLPMHPADVQSTQANIGKAQSLGYNPTTTIQEGIKYFANWFKEYHKGMYF